MDIIGNGVDIIKNSRIDKSLGFRSDINFIDIEINNYKNGRPYILLSKKLKNFLKKKFKIQKYKIFLSLSDEKDYSIAYVVINKKI